MKNNNLKIEPFVFKTSLPLVELTRYKARNLQELLVNIKNIDGSSIFYHTHHYVREHHFLSEEYPSDFAFWVAEVLQEKELGEMLSAIDILEFTSIRAIRLRIIEIIENYLRVHPEIRNVMTGLEFHFCKSVSVVVPTGYVANNLYEFRECLKRIDIYSIYYHLIEARLKYERVANDFSVWLKKNFSRVILADEINKLDPYMHTLEETRLKIISLISKQRSLESIREKISRYSTHTNVRKFIEDKKYFLSLKKAVNRALWKIKKEK